MLRILANENIPGPVVQALRAAGHDVAWIVEDTRGLDDPVVLKQAMAHGRLILTFDKDFGEMVYRGGLDASVGVVLLRITTRNPEEVANRTVLELGTHADDLPGNFTVVSDKKVRITKLPPRRAT